MVSGAQDEQEKGRVKPACFDPVGRCGEQLHIRYWTANREQV